MKALLAPETCEPAIKIFPTDTRPFNVAAPVERKGTRAEPEITEEHTRGPETDSEDPIRVLPVTEILPPAFADALQLMGAENFESPPTDRGEDSIEAAKTERPPPTHNLSCTDARLPLCMFPRTLSDDPQSAARTTEKIDPNRIDPLIDTLFPALAFPLVDNVPRQSQVAPQDNAALHIDDPVTEIPMNVAPDPPTDSLELKMADAVAEALLIYERPRT